MEKLLNSSTFYWVKSKFSFQAVMDILITDNILLISIINNKWKPLFKSDNFKFTHYIRLKKRNTDLTASIMLMQTYGWEVLFQTRYWIFSRYIRVFKNLWL